MTNFSMWLNERIIIVCYRGANRGVRHLDKWIVGLSIFFLMLLLLQLFFSKFRIVQREMNSVRMPANMETTLTLLDIANTISKLQIIYMGSLWVDKLKVTLCLWTMWISCFLELCVLVRTLMWLFAHVCVWVNWMKMKKQKTVFRV